MVRISSWIFKSLLRETLRETLWNIISFCDKCKSTIAFRIWSFEELDGRLLLPKRREDERIDIDEVACFDWLDDVVEWMSRNGGGEWHGGRIL